MSEKAVVIFSHLHVCSECKISNDFFFSCNRYILLTAIQHSTQLTANSIHLLHESHSDSELAAAAHDEKGNVPKRAETFGGFDRRLSQKRPPRHPAVIAEGTSEANYVTQRRDSGCSTTSLASKKFKITRYLRESGGSISDR